ncbi:MAG: NAD(P)-dependent oxidoreductase [Streptosporangiaceae bacterium]
MAAASALACSAPRSVPGHGDRRAAGLRADAGRRADGAGERARRDATGRQRRVPRAGAHPGSIAAAALDVTDPETLPDGHPLWTQQRCIIRPHTADPAKLSDPAFGRRISDKVSRFAAGQPLLGVVDPSAGY